MQNVVYFWYTKTQADLKMVFFTLYCLNLSHMQLLEVHQMYLIAVQNQMLNVWTVMGEKIIHILIFKNNLGWEPKIFHVWGYLVHSPDQSRANLQIISYLPWPHTIKFWISLRQSFHNFPRATCAIAQPLSQCKIVSLYLSGIPLAIFLLSCWLCFC